MRVAAVRERARTRRCAMMRTPGASAASAHGSGDAGATAQQRAQALNATMQAVVRGLARDGDVAIARVDSASSPHRCVIARVEEEGRNESQGTRRTVYSRSGSLERAARTTARPARAMSAVDVRGGPGAPRGLRERSQQAVSGRERDERKRGMASETQQLASVRIPTLEPAQPQAQRAEPPAAEAHALQADHDHGTTVAVAGIAALGAEAEGVGVEEEEAGAGASSDAGVGGGEVEGVEDEDEAGAEDEAGDDEAEEASASDSPLQTRTRPLLLLLHEQTRTRTRTPPLLLLLPSGGSKGCGRGRGRGKSREAGVEVEVEGSSSSEVPLSLSRASSVGASPSVEGSTTPAASAMRSYACKSRRKRSNEPSAGSTPCSPCAAPSPSTPATPLPPAPPPAAALAPADLEPEVAAAEFEIDVAATASPRRPAPPAPAPSPSPRLKARVISASIAARPSRGWAVDVDAGEAEAEGAPEREGQGREREAAGEETEAEATSKEEGQENPTHVSNVPSTSMLLLDSPAPGAGGAAPGPAGGGMSVVCTTPCTTTSVPAAGTHVAAVWVRLQARAASVSAGARRALLQVLLRVVLLLRRRVPPRRRQLPRPRPRRGVGGSRGGGGVELALGARRARSARRGGRGGWCAGRGSAWFAPCIVSRACVGFSTLGPTFRREKWRKMEEAGSFDKRTILKLALPVADLGNLDLTYIDQLAWQTTRELRFPPK
ncbi:hypothetical protein DFH09DRAFT_1499185 [Mycena vulgaris]|nr:hypothetical protein DFH09DRAFT_1499185 [Mycena vulgaris]